MTTPPLSSLVFTPLLTAAFDIAEVTALREGEAPGGEVDPDNEMGTLLRVAAAAAKAGIDVTIVTPLVGSLLPTADPRVGPGRSAIFCWTPPGGEITVQGFVAC